MHSYGGPRAPAVLAMADGQTAAPGPQGFALAPALKTRLPRQGAARPARPDYFQSITAYDTVSVLPALASRPRSPDEMSAFPVAPRLKCS